MKKTHIAAIAISPVLLSLIAGTYLPQLARADSIGVNSGATLISPANTTYSSRFLTLNLTLAAGFGVKYSFNYSIDGEYRGSIPLVAINTSELHVINVMIGSVELPELPDGSHYLTVNELSGIYGYYGANPPGAPFKPSSPGSLDYVASWTHTVYFTINSSSQPSLNPTPAPSPSHSLNPSSLSPRVQKHFVVNSTLYAFQGSELLCSFNATSGCWVQLDLTVTVNNTFETIFEVASSSNGMIFNFKIYGSAGHSNLTQRVFLNYDDDYNITVAKHPFYSTVAIKGTIDLCQIEAINSEVTPSYSPSSSHSPSPTFSSSPTPQPTLEPSSTLDNIQAENFTTSLIITVLAIAAVVASSLFSFKKRKW